jgi:hypothetical protein
VQQCGSGHFDVERLAVPRPRNHLTCSYGVPMATRTVHDHRHLLRLCTSRCRLECRVLLVGAGPVGLVEHRPRRPEAARSLSLDRAAGITRPIGSASTLMPPGMLRGS